jgi:hypothetical protein
MTGCWNVDKSSTCGEEMQHTFTVAALVLLYCVCRTGAV